MLFKQYADAGMPESNRIKTIFLVPTHARDGLLSFVGKKFPTSDFPMGAPPRVKLNGLAAAGG
jgi:hypothetical protein